VLAWENQVLHAVPWRRQLMVEKMFYALKCQGSALGCIIITGELEECGKEHQLKTLLLTKL
jgi:hypothetical protein